MPQGLLSVHGNPSSPCIHLRSSPAKWLDFELVSFEKSANETDIDDRTELLELIQ